MVEQTKTEELVARLREDADMMRDGHQDNLTELWHSEVVLNAAKDAQDAAELIIATTARIAALEGALASRFDLAEELREYTAMKYAGDCKCGKCQLVPRELIDRLRAALASTEAMKGE